MASNSPIPEPKGSGKGRGVLNTIVQAEKMVQVALILPCAAFIGWIAGEWIGNRLQQPWISAAGLIFGGAAGLFHVIRMALDEVKEPKGKNKPGGQGSTGGAA